MNHLLRDLAPITAKAWSIIDDEARERLTVALAARRVVDVSEPHGWEYSATNLGAVGAPLASPIPQVVARTREVLPVTEFRVAFSLSREELGNVARGATDLDLEVLDVAARQLAEAENSAVFTGWPAGGITGIIEASPHEPLRHDHKPEKYAAFAAEAVSKLMGAGIDGPYALAVGPADWVDIIESSDKGGYPLLRHLQEIIGGAPIWTPGLDGAVVLSQQGGDFLLELGEDASIGYSHHTADTVELYLQESFSFRVDTPEAAIAILPS